MRYLTIIFIPVLYFAEKQVKMEVFAYFDIQCVSTQTVLPSVVSRSMFLEHVCLFGVQAVSGVTDSL